MNTLHCSLQSQAAYNVRESTQRRMFFCSTTAQIRSACTHKKIDNHARPPWRHDNEVTKQCTVISLHLHRSSPPWMPDSESCTLFARYLATLSVSTLPVSWALSLWDSKHLLGLDSNTVHLSRQKNASGKNKKKKKKNCRKEN